MKRAIVVPLGMLAVALAALTGSAQQGGAPSGPAAADSFPHADHEGLFPLCGGCHEGVERGDAATLWPAPESCDGCHDGADQRRVEWTPPAPDEGSVVFSHPEHAVEVGAAGEPEVDCAGCHQAPDAGRMTLSPLDAGGCLTCHGGAPETHLESADCASCHRPLAGVSDGARRIAALPTPVDHDPEGFLARHEPGDDDGLLRCATCHTQDRCAACHVDTGLDAIQALAPAPEGWVLPAWEARYPVPADHADRDFQRSHGWPAPAPADCSTCHTSDDCASCHLEPLPPSAAGLPDRPPPATNVPQERPRGPGVGLEAGLPASHESPFFLQAHAAAAVSGEQTCASCHTESYCAACHQAPGAPGYHPSGFVARHAAEAGRASMECASCHNVQAFCRQCHVEVGLQSTGRLGSGYHDAEPLWLLRHGQGARQGLEQCASCHTQKECLQCHSQFGAFKVSPHGPDFDPERAREANPWICRACHLGGAGAGGDR